MTIERKREQKRVKVHEIERWSCDNVMWCSISTAKTIWSEATREPLANNSNNILTHFEQLKQQWVSLSQHAAPSAAARRTSSYARAAKWWYRDRATRMLSIKSWRWQLFSVLHSEHFPICSLLLLGGIISSFIYGFSNLIGAQGSIFTWVIAFGMKIFFESLQALHCGMENRLGVSDWKRLVDNSSGVNICRQIEQRFERA